MSQPVQYPALYPTHAAARALTRALAQFDHRDRQLRESVELYVRIATAAGETPDEILCSILELLHDHAPLDTREGYASARQASVLHWTLDTVERMVVHAR